MKGRTKRKKKKDWTETAGFAYLILVVFLVGLAVGMVVCWRPRIIIGIPVSTTPPSNYPHVGGVRI